MIGSYRKHGKPTQLLRSAQCGTMEIGSGNFCKERNGPPKCHGVYQKPSFMGGKFVPALNELSSVPWRRMGTWRYSSTILELGTRWRWVVTFTPRPPYPRGKGPRCSLQRRLDGPENRSWCCLTEKSLSLDGNRTPAVQSIAIPTSQK
jgi:hypothetical protein